ncbi:eEF1A lysine and N-terminal methyltransferase isoform X1 [Polyodon spathula]|uniref:eEF1A lysine and N-terminal methyltransferase isoform X1 n=1 Tax=Polyodon spathula TaxID=7913 RepID=UPI001B7E7053|nr:eEF1A lysine and N-terminal methyltransferase isoform X1 [Polyodon spathula]
MNLLPKSSKEFSSAEYWEKFFKKRGDKSFEWYGTYTELCGVLHKYIKPTDTVLVVGCGSSELSEQLYDAGYRDLTNIDISTTAIARMQERNSARRPSMTFLCVDAQRMEPFADGSFQAALDKGTLDALAPDGSPDTVERVGRVFAEVGRVLRVGGRYVCVTLAQEHVLRAAVEHFSGEGWAVRVHRVEGQEGGFCLPVFVLVCTKFRRPAEGSAALPQILEVCEGEEGPPRRLGAPEELLGAVMEIQAYALLRSQLASHTDPAQTPTLQLCHTHTGQPRYSCHVVDSPAGATLHRASHFAVFIVPQGRETNWLFGTAEGRSQLAGSAGFRRLVVVAMHRDQEYQDMQAIQSELSAKVMELAPPGLPANHQVPFLSVGGDLGERSVMHRGSSTFSGDFVVEDVRGDEGRLYRRLIFLSNSSVVQSESLLRETGNPGNTHTAENLLRETGNPGNTHTAESLLRETGNPGNTHTAENLLRETGNPGNTHTAENLLRETGNPGNTHTAENLLRETGNPGNTHTAENLLRETGNPGNTHTAENLLRETDNPGNTHTAENLLRETGNPGNTHTAESLLRETGNPGNTHTAESLLRETGNPGNTHTAESLLGETGNPGNTHTAENLLRETGNPGKGRGTHPGSAHRQHPNKGEPATRTPQASVSTTVQKRQARFIFICSFFS